MEFLRYVKVGLSIKLNGIRKDVIDRPTFFLNKNNPKKAW